MARTVRLRIGTLALLFLLLGAPVSAGQDTVSFNHDTALWGLFTEAWRALTELLPAKPKSGQDLPQTTQAPPENGSGDELPEPDRGGGLDPIG